MTQFTIRPKGPFSLQSAQHLQCGFLRGSRAACDAESVRMAFPRDGDFAITGVSLRYDSRTLTGEVVGSKDADSIRAQVARVLGLNHDARPFVRLVEREPVLRALWWERPGFRPVVAYSPYVMGGWAVLSQRLRMSQAAALQVRIAEASGDTIHIEGQTLASFPRPESILSRSSFPGVPEEKWRRLQVIAQAALRGDLEIDRLTSVPYEVAHERLLELHGVGPWTADAILLRGCGPTDLLPLSEPSLHRAVAAAYGLTKPPSDAELVRIAEAWRPFRTWISVFLISAQARRTEEDTTVHRGTRPHAPQRIVQRSSARGQEADRGGDPPRSPAARQDRALRVAQP
jgi:DNA-3-methyladenine glycosylase II